MTWCKQVVILPGSVSWSDWHTTRCCSVQWDTLHWPVVAKTQLYSEFGCCGGLSGGDEELMLNLLYNTSAPSVRQRYNTATRIITMTWLSCAIPKRKNNHNSRPPLSRRLFGNRGRTQLCGQYHPVKTNRQLLSVFLLSPLLLQSLALFSQRT